MCLVKGVRFAVQYVTCARVIAHTEPVVDCFRQNNIVPIYVDSLEHPAMRHIEKRREPVTSANDGLPLSANQPGGNGL